MLEVISHERFRDLLQTALPRMTKQSRRKIVNTHATLCGIYTREIPKRNAPLSGEETLFKNNHELQEKINI